MAEIVQELSEAWLENYQVSPKPQVCREGKRERIPAATTVAIQTRAVIWLVVWFCFGSSVLAETTATGAEHHAYRNSGGG